MSKKILHIDASARFNGSLTREVSDYFAKKLSAQTEQQIVHRDLATSELPLVTEKHIEAYYTQPQDRSDDQKALLEISDAYISELKAADTLIIGAPIYNFSVPASLKAWIDLVCRVGETFVYTENGPKGLTEIDNVYIVVATGGVPVGSPVDFNSAYLKQIATFIGAKHSHVIDLSGSKREVKETIAVGKNAIDEILSELVAA